MNSTPLKKNTKKHTVADYIHTIVRRKSFLVIAVLFVLLVGICRVYVFPSSAFSFGKGDTSHPHLNPSLMLHTKEDRIVNFNPLRVSLTKKYEKRDDYLVSIYFEYLPTGANISINKDEKIWPASLIKIPVAMAVMKKVEDKKWSLDNELVIMDEDKDQDYGDMYKEPTGTTHTIREFLTDSLAHSDNTAHFVLLRNIDNQELEDVYTHLGLDDIIDALKKSPKQDAEVDNRITAKRYTVFFRSLYDATFLNQQYSELFLDILSNAPKELLSNGLPESVAFVHKTGVRADEAVRADSGIVYVEGRPYLITVMLQKKDKGPLNEEEVNGMFKDISQEIYNYVANAH